jgi:hypothetical protein
LDVAPDGTDRLIQRTVGEEQIEIAPIDLVCALSAMSVEGFDAGQRVEAQG